MLTEERVREIREALWQGTGRDANDADVDALAADWLALRAQNAALRLMVEEAVANLSCESMGHTAYDLHDLGAPCPPIERFRARLAALGEP